MSMFLQENMGVVPLEEDDDELSSGGDNEALDEDGIFSGVKKFLNGSGRSEPSLTDLNKATTKAEMQKVIDTFERRLVNKATTKAEMQKVIDTIERRLEYTEQWLKDSALADPWPSIADSEDDKKKIKQESNLLKGLKSRAQGKLRSLRN